MFILLREKVISLLNLSRANPSIFSLTLSQIGVSEYGGRFGLVTQWTPLL